MRYSGQDKVSYFVEVVPIESVSRSPIGYDPNHEIPLSFAQRFPLGDGLFDVIGPFWRYHQLQQVPLQKKNSVIPYQKS